MAENVLRDATTGWTEALTEAARNLNLAAADLQDDWADLSHELESQGDQPLPDPIKLIRRIHALELSVRSLEQDCGDMVDRRRKAVLVATSQLASLRDLCHSEAIQNLAPMNERDLQRTAELESRVFREQERYQEQERLAGEDDGANSVTRN